MIERFFIFLQSPDFKINSQFLHIFLLSKHMLDQATDQVINPRGEADAKQWKWKWKWKWQRFF